LREARKGSAKAEAEKAERVLREAKAAVEVARSRELAAQGEWRDADTRYTRKLPLMSDSNWPGLPVPQAR